MDMNSLTAEIATMMDGWNKIGGCQIAVPDSLEGGTIPNLQGRNEPRARHQNRDQK